MVSKVPTFVALNVAPRLPTDEMVPDNCYLFAGRVLMDNSALWVHHTAEVLDNFHLFARRVLIDNSALWVRHQTAEVLDNCCFLEGA